MKIKSEYALLWIVFFTLSSMLSVGFLYVSNIDPNFTNKNEETVTLNFIWDEPPIIINCSDSPYTIEEVQAALDNIAPSKIEYLDVIDNFLCPLDDPSDENLAPETVIGAITIQSSSSVHLHKDALAATTSFMYGVVIEVLNKRERVLEHELAHAFGFSHIEKIGHLMNPDWEFGGFDIGGMNYPKTAEERKNYTKLSEI